MELDFAIGVSFCGDAITRDLDFPLNSMVDELHCHLQTADEP